jgi:hypothetical protein
MAMHDKSVVDRLLSERRSRRFSVHSALDRVVGDHHVRLRKLSIEGSRAALAQNPETVLRQPAMILETTAS